MGTVIRSGPSMCRKMTEFIEPQKDKIIVELGAGDGVITSYILDVMEADATLFVFEINADLCKVVSKIQDKRMILINDGAQNLQKYLDEYQITQVDMIISAIPFLVLPEELTQEILLLCKEKLKANGVFVQMHYAKTIQKLYKSIFGNVESFFVPLNIPPGYVFKCINKK